MQLVSNVDQDTDFFWEQLFDSYDDENNLADTVDMLTRLYMKRKIKALYWTIAIMKGQGINLPLYILTGTAFANPEVTLFYFGSFFLRIAWRMLQSMEKLGMEDFLYDRRWHKPEKYWERRLLTKSSYRSLMILSKRVSAISFSITIHVPIRRQLLRVTLP